MIGSVESYTRISISAVIYASMHILPFSSKKCCNRSVVKRSMGFSGVELLSRIEYNGQIESLENFVVVVVERDGLNIIIFIFFQSIL